MTERKCADCGAPFTGHGNRKYCSQRCLWKSKQRKRGVPCSVCGTPMMAGTGVLPAGEATCLGCRRKKNEPRETSCAICGTLFVQSKQEKCCSRECRYAKAIQSRGFTSAWRACEVCGDKYRYSHPQQRTCGRRCGMALQGRSRSPVKPPSCRVYYLECDECDRWFVSRRSSAKRCSSECQRKRNRRITAQRYRDTAGLTGECRCTRCGEPMAGFWSKFCETCRPDLSGHISRAKHWGVPWERIAPRIVFNRDGWICGICGEDIDRDAKHPDPWSASLDHVVPLSKGGPHMYGNVQAAHLWCNIVKHNDADFTLRASA